jgi:hypothetical protein
MLLQISDILPRFKKKENFRLYSFYDFYREPQGVRACCNPVPLLVQHNLHDIHQIILLVRDIPLLEVRYSSFFFLID